MLSKLRPLFFTKAKSKGIFVKSFGRKFNLPQFLFFASVKKPRHDDHHKEFFKNIYQRIEESGKGEPLFEEPKIPLDDYNEIRNLRQLISQTISLGKYEEGLEASKKYIEKIQFYYGVNHPAFYSGLNNFALILKIIGQFEESRMLYEKVLEGYTKLFGIKHLSTVTVMQNLANLYKETKEHDKAIKTFYDVIALRNELKPEEVTEIAICKSSLAGSLREMQKFEESERLLEESLAILQKKYGEENLLTVTRVLATCLNNMALTYKRQKKFSKAEEYYLRCLATREKFLPEDHPEMFAVKHNLGELYLAMGHEEKGQKYLIEAMEILKRADEQKGQSKK